MKYKPGDKVKIKSLDWYNTFKDEYGVVDCGQWLFEKEMSKFCGKIVTICESDDMFNWYRISEEKNPHIRYNNNMIEGFADESQEKMVSLEDVCEFLDEHLYTNTSTGDYDYGKEYICSDFDNASDLIFALRKAMEE